MPADDLQHRQRQPAIVETITVWRRLAVGLKGRIYIGRRLSK
jgi:hypothetical protein